MSLDVDDQLDKGNRVYIEAWTPLGRPLRRELVREKCTRCGSNLVDGEPFWCPSCYLEHVWDPAHEKVIGKITEYVKKPKGGDTNE